MVTVSPTPEAPWIMVPVVAPTLAEVRKAAADLISSAADAVEWRADRYAEGEWSAPVSALRGTGLPLLLTLRTELEAGPTWTDAAYAAAVRALLRLGPDLVDIEGAWPQALSLVAEATDAGALPVVSRHEPGCPADPAAVLAGLRQVAGAHGIVKLAVTAGSEEELATLAAAGRDAADSGPVIVIGMGEAGHGSRLHPAAYGSCVTFAALGAGSAPGQLPVRDIAAALGRR